MRALVIVVVIAVVAIIGYFVWDRYAVKREEPQVTLAVPTAPEAAPTTPEASAPAPSAAPTPAPAPAAEQAASPPDLAPSPQPAPAATAGPESSAASQPASPAVAEPEPAPPPAATETTAGAEAPTFDIVRVDPEGKTVIAGRAEPGAKVTVSEGKTVIGEATASPRGEWVIVPEAPLESGTRELALEAETPTGGKLESESVVVVAVPERPATPAPEAAATPSPEVAETPSPEVAETPSPQVAGTPSSEVAGTPSPEGGESAAEPGVLAVLVPREGVGSKVLQAPEGEAGLQGEKDLSLAIIEYDDKGNVALGGRGKEGSEVRAYVDDKFVGSAAVGETSDWRVTPENPVEPGVHRLRIDQVDKTGKVIARIETPFARSGFRLPGEDESLVVVQPGNSLWRIARRTYGQGIQYALIFRANRDQIRDPDLIYPGQVFVLPRTN